MTLKIKYFGLIAELISKEEEFLDGSFSSVGKLEKYLLEQYPNLHHQNFKMAVNHNIVNNDYKLSGNEEIALLPPFSGG